MRPAGKGVPEVVTITDLTHDGRGVAKTDGKTVFVDGALPGETVRMVRMKRRRSLDEARTEEIIEASPDRTQPGCDHFGICGGCSLQHLTSDAQLRAKDNLLHEDLSRIGGVTASERFAPVSGPAWAYRRRARLGARMVEGKGRVLVGFREKFKPFVADIKGCPVLADPAGTLIEPLSTLLTGLSISRRVPQVEVCVADNRTALVIRVLEKPSADDLVALRDFQELHDVDVYLQTKGIDTVRSIDESAPALTYRLDRYGVELRFLPTDFIQVNAALNASMIDRAIELLDLPAGGSVLDLFCGIGNFSLPLAQTGVRVTGVEGEQGLVDRARANAAHNQLENAEFFCADLFEDCSQQSWLKDSYDAALLDPPRAGAAEIIQAVVDCGVEKIVYVSCHSATLARDAGVLVQKHGFELKGAGVLDMFPHTTHVESIALFERNSG